MNEENESIKNMKAELYRMKNGVIVLQVKKGKLRYSHTYDTMNELIYDRWQLLIKNNSKAPWNWEGNDTKHILWEEHLWVKYNQSMWDEGHEIIRLPDPIPFYWISGRN